MKIVFYYFIIFTTIKIFFMIFKKILCLFFLFFLINNGKLKAEIIENKKIFNKAFDVWNVSCEEDEMLNEIGCRLFVEVTGGTIFFVNPLSNENPVLISSKDSYFDRRMYVKIDTNKLMISQPMANNKYNIVNFSQAELKTIANQIKGGKNLYLRFTIKDTTSPNGFKEITAKISLAEFQKALDYHNKQINKYSSNVNNVN